MGEGDDDAVPRADEPLELVLGLGDPACGDRRALRLEAMRLPLRERVELGRAVQLDGETLLLADAAHVVRLPDEVGRTLDGRDEIGRRLRRRGVGLVGAEVRLDEVGAPLGGGVDRRLVGGVERTLRERRERANLLDLVAEEVDAKRLATRRREHVDEAAADGELPALVHAIDALVARERELLGEPVDARLVADAELERGRSGLERRQAVGERRADAQTRPPAASMSSARYRSPTRCGGGTRPDS